MRYFDDLKVGDRFESERFRVTARDIIAFSRQFDPQSFHLDAQKAKRTIFKGIVTSGWHTAAITMGLFVRTLNFGGGAIGLGVDRLRWPAPVRPGDIVRVETKILRLRRCRSRPEFGIVRLSNTTRNHNDEIVQKMLASALVRRRR
jgi:acyl dehydratase